MVSVAFLASAAASMVGSAPQIRPPSVNETVETAADPSMYFVDALFRSSRIAAEAGDATVKAEAARILVRGLKEKQIPSADQSYLVTLVTARTGISLPDAERRVSDVITEARQAEDNVRKATAHLLLWLFLSLLMGAFSASFAATIGGRQRDHVKPV